MKKLIIYIALLSVIFTLGTMPIFAENTHPDPNVVAGGYVTGEKSLFEPVGDIVIEWVPDASEKIDLSDGKLDDWAEYSPTVITPQNMISWYMGDDFGKPANNGEGIADPTMPANWTLTAYFLADPDYLYVGFYITDPDCVAGSGHYHTGDAFQINIDFGGKLGWVIENDPFIADMMPNKQNVFYSFCYTGDGTPIVIYRDCSEDDRILTLEEDGVKGTTAKTSDGWSAEFILPWQVMYNDYAEKGWISNIRDSAIYMGGVDDVSLATGMALYYLNHSTNEDGSTNVNDWTAGTGNGVLAANGAPAVSWDAYDNGITLLLEPEEGIRFTSPNIKVLGEDETLPPDDPETEPTETETQAPVDTEAQTEPQSETEAAVTETTIEEITDTDTEMTTEAPTESKGCASVLGISAVALLMIGVIAPLLKKED